jgi:tetratricopeptide (TPR) repeat protein
MARNNSNPRKSPEWREAENWFNKLHTVPVFSIMGGSMMPGPDAGGLDGELENLLVSCPSYFPGWFYRGEYMLRIGKNTEGEKYIEKGFEQMAEVLDDEGEFERVLYQRIENLEKLLRYDLTAKLMEKAVRLYPDTAPYYDDLAYYILQLPARDKNEALRMQEKAMEIDPDDDCFINNLGWIYLMMGNFKEAETYFQKALDFNVDNPGALKNLDTAEYMMEHKLNYSAYLLRPAGMDEINKLRENVDFEGAAELCREYNADRVDAFKLDSLQNNIRPAHEILDIIQPFLFFMNDVEKNAADEIFLYENIDLLCDRFKFFLYRFIITTEFIEEQFLSEINRSLGLFYDFLRDGKLISPGQHKRFTDQINSTIGEFSRRIEDYNRIRHDINLQEKEREAAIEELFGIRYSNKG